MPESTSEQTQATGVTTLNESERHDVLRAARRRHVVDILEGRTDPIDLDGLAVLVAARGSETDSTDTDDVERVAASLHHIHLPKLASFDLVDYDRADHLVERCRISAGL